MRAVLRAVNVPRALPCLTVPTSRPFVIAPSKTSGSGLPGRLNRSRPAAVESGTDWRSACPAPRATSARPPRTVSASSPGPRSV